MPISDLDQEKIGKEQESRIQLQIAFASGLFQGDVTVRTLLESLTEGVVVIDNSGIMLLVNTAADQMFGYPKQELIGKAHSVLIPDRFRSVHEKHIAHYFEAPRIRPMGRFLDLAGRRQDGSEFPLEISLSFIETINGILVLVLFTDITQRKQAEKTLQQKEELFHKQLECVKDYAIYMLDAQGNVLNWNVGAERLKGYRAEEIIGKHFSCFFSEEDRKAGKPVDELQKAATGGWVAQEGWRLRRDGSRFWADVVITALRDENGNLCGFSKVTHDITERKRAEDELKNANMQKELILASAGEGILGLDLEGKHTFVNASAAAMLGYDIKELVGKESHLMWHYAKPDGSLYPADECPIYAAYKAGVIHTGEEMFWRKDGTGFPVEFTSRPMFSDNGIVGAVLTFNNITEHKRVVEEIKILNTNLNTRTSELEEANQVLEAFNYTVAHDLRKPLNVINGYCQAIINDQCVDNLDARCKSYFQETYNGTLRMNRLIEALLKFSRLIHIDLHRQTVDLCAIAKDVTAELKLADPKRWVTFQIADGAMSVDGDADLLRVVLDNLLGNAWKFTRAREKAIIEFGATEINGKPVFFVRDNGAGFDMADADKLFTPFQPLPGDEQYRGLGTGLATVERIIRHHGGKVWALGETEKGATFYFSLPAENVST